MTHLVAFVFSPASTFFSWNLIWLAVAAFLGGALNAVAGGGSFLTFPALLGHGIPPGRANATNPLALWPGQLTSIAAYRHDVRKHLRLAILMGLGGFVGGSICAIVLLHTPQQTFLHHVPGLLLISATNFAASGPVTRLLDKRKGKTHGAEVNP